MTTEEIVQELLIFIRRAFSIPSDDLEFTRSVDLFNYGYVDSFGAIELMAFIEKRFGVTIEPDDWVGSALATPLSFAQLIHTKQER